MYELASRLRQKYNVLPVHFFCSGTASPRLYTMPNAYLLTDDKIIEVLKVIGHSLADELYSNQHLRQKWMPAIRADLEMMASYQAFEEPPLTCPITAIRTRGDLWSYFYGTQTWGEYTTKSFDLITRQGNHFFLEKESNFAVDLITDKCKAGAGGDSHG